MVCVRFEPLRQKDRQGWGATAAKALAGLRDMPAGNGMAGLAVSAGQKSARKNKVRQGKRPLLLSVWKCGGPETALLWVNRVSMWGIAWAGGKALRAREWNGKAWGQLLKREHNETGGLA